MIGGHLWRIAKRNARRHKAQAVAAAAAVAVGTMVLSASLLAGQAAEGGIRQVAFDVLGETDELVHTEGDFFVPRQAADDFQANVRDRRLDVAVSPTVTHTAVARTPQGQTEPETLMIGYPEAEEGFGRFVADQGSSTLGEGVLVNERLAEPLNLAPGDTVRLRYSKPIDPVVPEVHRFSGNLSGAGSRPPLPGPAPPPTPDTVQEPVTDRHTFNVSNQATRVLAVLAWASPQNATDLDLALTSADGTTVTNRNGTTGQPDAPAVLEAEPANGTWTVEVQAEAAVDQPYRLAVLVLRPAYSLEELREGRRELSNLGPLRDRLAQARGTTVTNATVAGVVAGEGKGGFTGEPAAFLPIERLQRMLDRGGQINLVRISNPGGPREGLERTGEVMPVLRASLNETQSRFAAPSVQALSVEPTKANLVDRAERAGAQFTRFLTTLSSFTIVAGILLVVNLFTMLGEERRVELSVMRALGTKRRHLVGSLSFEGLLYAIPGAPIGSLLGLGLAYVLIDAVNDFVIGPDSLPIPFVLDWSTLLVAGIAGLVLTMLAVVAVGVWLSRVNVASGLKDRSDPSPSDGSSGWLVAILLGGLVTLLHLATGYYTPLLVGPCLVLAGLGWRGARRFGSRVSRFAASGAVIPYGLWTVLAFENVPAAENPILAPTRGVLLVLAAVVALLNTPGLPRALKALARRTGRYAPASLVAVSYPTRKQLRTGLTASMFALVLLVLIFFSTFFTVFEVDPQREAGGYDIYAETRLPVDDLGGWAEANLDQAPASLERIDVSDEMPVARVVGGDVITIDGRSVNYNGPPIDVFYGTTRGFVQHNDYELVARSQRFPSDEAAYEAVRSDPSNAVVSRVYDVDANGRLGRIEGGERMRLDLASRSLNFTILGAQSQQYLGGVFVHPGTVRDLFPSHGTGVLITTRSGEDPQQVARQLESDFTRLGLDAESIREQARRTQQQNARFFTVLQVFLGIGLVIGVASLGIVTAKAALEREHELGVMRAMGVPSQHVTFSLVGEALLTAVLGFLPGLAVGISTAYAAYLAFFAEAGAAFSIPWTSIAILATVTVLATLASTIPPARRAARQDPAEAVRMRR